MNNKMLMAAAALLGPALADTSGPDMNQRFSDVASRPAPRKSLPHANRPTKPKNNKAHRKALKRERSRLRRLDACVKILENLPKLEHVESHWNEACSSCGVDHMKG